MSNVEHCFRRHRQICRLAKIFFEEVIRNFLETVSANRRDSDVMFDHQLGQLFAIDEHNAFAFNTVHEIDRVPRVIRSGDHDTFLGADRITDRAYTPPLWYAT
jgi:hypothetical protein